MFTYQLAALHLRLAIKSLGWALVPGFCVLCKLPSHRARDLCIYCEHDLPWLAQFASSNSLDRKKFFTTFSPAFSETDTTFISATCARNISVTGNRNTPLAAEKSAFTKTVAPLAYKGTAAWLVRQQKHRKGVVPNRVLAELLSDAVLRSYALPGEANHPASANWPDALLPVPLHWSRTLHRGHNQSLLLAQELSKRCRLPILEYAAERIRYTPSQQTLDRSDRNANMLDAFSASRAVAGLCVAIVDDVITTGATATALARALHTAGAAEIHLWAPTRAILE